MTYLARMINKTCGIPPPRRIHREVFVYFEHVTSDALGLVVTFPVIRQRIPNNLKRDRKLACLVAGALK